MKPKSTLPTLALLSCSALVALAQPAQAKPQCTMSNVAGDYGYTSTGSVVSPPVGPFAAVGRVTITGAGTFTGEQTTNVGGNVADETITGTYAVDPDCTGTAVAAQNDPTRPLGQERVGRYFVAQRDKRRAPVRLATGQTSMDLRLFQQRLQRVCGV